MKVSGGGSNIHADSVPVPVAVARTSRRRTAAFRAARPRRRTRQASSMTTIKPNNANPPNTEAKDSSVAVGARHRHVLSPTTPTQYRPPMLSLPTSPSPPSPLPSPFPSPPLLPRTLLVPPLIRLFKPPRKAEFRSSKNSDGDGGGGGRGVGGAGERRQRTQRFRFMSRKISPSLFRVAFAQAD